jgi:hypothetical protein
MIHNAINFGSPQAFYLALNVKLLHNELICFPIITLTDVTGVIAKATEIEMAESSTLMVERIFC